MGDLSAFGKWPLLIRDGYPVFLLFVHAMIVLRLSGNNERVFLVRRNLGHIGCPNAHKCTISLGDSCCCDWGYFDEMKDLGECCVSFQSLLLSCLRRV